MRTEGPGALPRMRTQKDPSPNRPHWSSTHVCMCFSVLMGSCKHLSDSTVCWRHLLETDVLVVSSAAAWERCFTSNWCWVFVAVMIWWPKYAPGPTVGGAEVWRSTTRLCQNARFSKYLMYIKGCQRLKTIRTFSEGKWCLMVTLTG